MFGNGGEYKYHGQGIQQSEQQQGRAEMNATGAALTGAGSQGIGGPMGGGSPYGFTAGTGMVHTAGEGIPRVETRVGDGNGNLPNHIEARVANDGRLFYLNHRTKKTFWTLPRPEEW